MGYWSARRTPTANMNIQRSNSPLEVALTNIDDRFRKRIIEHYLAAKRSLAEGKDEAVGMAAGKLCEVILRLLQNIVHGNFIPFNKSIGNFADECRKLVTSSNAASPETIRVVVPRALVFVYTVRNKRGIGHIGGDVDANHIDAMTIARNCDWIVCELIRVFHGLSLEEAQAIVDGLAIRSLPDVWEVAGKRRVLRTDLTAKQKVLLLCHQSTDGAILAEDLCDWIEYSNPSVFKAKVLLALHRERMIEFDGESESVFLSPLGVKEVEERILNATAS